MKIIEEASDDYPYRLEAKNPMKALQKGLIVLDKPPGPTSHQTITYLKNVLGIEKAGHSGTLDPRVTGVLPVALNDATRITNYLLGQKKQYVTVMYVHDEKSKKEIEQVLEDFRGEITQLPPKKSAIKREERQRSIQELKLLEKNGQDVLVKVTCDAGTYIRKLVHDIGERLGCGAHMADLRRTQSGGFTEEESHTLHEISDQYHFYKNGEKNHFSKIVRPIQYGVRHHKKIWVFDSALESLSHGSYLKIPGIKAIQKGIRKNEKVNVVSENGELVLIGESVIDADNMESRGLAVKTEQVYLKPVKKKA